MAADGKLIEHALIIIRSIVNAMPELQPNAEDHCAIASSILERTSSLVNGKQTVEHVVRCWVVAAFWIAVKWHEAHLRLTLDDIIAPAWGKSSSDLPFEECRARVHEILLWEMRCLAAIGFRIA